jgi:hypothetical protein
MNEIENLFLRNLNPDKDGIIDYYKLRMLMWEQATYNGSPTRCQVIIQISNFAHVCILVLVIILEQ